MATIEQIEQMFKKCLEPVNSRMEDMKDRMEEMNNRMDEMGNTMGTANKLMAEIMEESKSNKEKFNKLETNVVDIQKEVEFIKSELIKKNLMLFGLPEKTNEYLPEMLIKFFKEYLQIMDMNIWEIVEAKRIGKNRTDNSIRGIKIELTTKTRKMQILGKTRLLRGTNYRLQPEFTNKVMEDRKILKPYMNEAREKGFKSHLVYNKIKIGEKVYTVQEITKQVKNEEKENQNNKAQNKNEGRTWHEDSEDDDENAFFSTPKNNSSVIKFQNNQEPVTSGSEKGAIPKRKNISPLTPTQTEEDLNLNEEIKKIREEGPRKHKQPKINTLFREGTKRNFN